MPSQAQSESHQRLNEKVTSFIEGNCSVDEAVGMINYSKRSVPQKGIDTAKNIVKAVVTCRLRESAQDVIYAGKRQVNLANVERLQGAIRDARASGYVDQDVDINEFDTLCRNMEVRAYARAPYNEDTILWFLEHLQNYGKKAFETEEDADATMLVPETQQVTDQTLTYVCRGMLKGIRQDPDLCRRMSLLGAVPHLRRILLATMQAIEATEQMEKQQPQHPELQAHVAMILAELAYHCSSGAALRSKKLDMLRSTFKDDTEEGQKQTGDSQASCDILLLALRHGVARYEHALVFAAIEALQRAADHPANQRHLLLTGIIPTLRKCIDAYEGLEGRLPEPKGRPLASPLRCHEDAPAFKNWTPGGSNALSRSTGSFKQMMLSPELPVIEKAPRHNAINWLAGTPMAASTTPKPLRAVMSPKRKGPKPMTFLKSGGDALAPMLMRSLSAPSGDFYGATAAAAQQKSQAPPEKEWPSLMWLVGEDGVHKDAYFRCSDKGLITVRARRLLAVMESNGANMASPFSALRRRRDERKQAERTAGLEAESRPTSLMDL
eukprot:TRINITY_DN38587_c0_g1_i1.p1 TRINITY_DN38587_c0_g1~~TRINITY_DN38587_c0_g1_i1.p1  ORF type:complete len:552 (-),score=128.03 TRINITY_DN38587_c0_g1_i1:186-1841(-)